MVKEFTGKNAFSSSLKALPGMPPIEAQPGTRTPE